MDRAGRLRRPQVGGGWWTKEEPEFHGGFVDFGPDWSYPKPVTPGDPRVLMGAGSKWTGDRLVEYCDGWRPIDGFNPLDDGIEELRAACDRAERDKLTIEPLTVPDEGRLSQLMELGIDRPFMLLPSEDPSVQEKSLDDYAKLIEKLGS